jgi:hypothetical protein
MYAINANQWNIVKCCYKSKAEFYDFDINSKSANNIKNGIQVELYFLNLLNEQISI